MNSENVSKVKTQFNQTGLIGTRWGMMIGLSCDAYQTASLSFYGEWAKAECELACSFLKPGDVVLDVGANIGSITMAFARKIGPTGTVFAFEPQRAAYYCLCGNIALNHLLNSVRAFNVAVSDFDGTIEVPVVDVSRPFNVGGVRLEDHFYDEKTKLPKEEVPCLRIDSMQLPRVDFIKIDVETMESKVLAGASETIDRCKPVILAEAMMDAPNTIESVNREAMEAFLTAHGYDFKPMATPLHSADNVRYCADTLFPGHDRNLIAIPAERDKPEWFNQLPAIN